MTDHSATSELAPRLIVSAGDEALDFYARAFDSEATDQMYHDGRLVTLAGNGTQGYDGDGGHALEASLNFPEALFMDQRGRLFIGDEWNNAVRMVDTDGLISTVIGTGFPGRAQIGGVARISPVDDPENILLTSNGLIIADGNNVRRISTTGGGFDTRSKKRRQ